MFKIIFIRHGKTKGNEEKRYIGSTDEDILPSEKERLSLKQYPKADIIFTSGMKRCVQTADIIYPAVPKEICFDFRESDFGEFENKNYDQLKDNPNYQKWLDSMGTIPIPGGESGESFRNRCTLAFEKIIKEYENKDITAAFVVHGGTIMAIMEKFAVPHRGFYSWQVKNGGGFVCGLNDDKTLKVIEKIE